MVLVAPKYEVSNFGRIRNVRTGYILKQGLANGKYPRVTIATVNGEKPVLIARQVLLAFTQILPSPKHIVGYRDLNVLNTNIENLFWDRGSSVRQRMWDTGVFKKRQTYAFQDKDLRKAVIMRMKAKWAAIKLK